jgi:uncharacterized protein (UPF0332 family)
MDSKVEMYLKRARTEMDSATLLFEVSGSQALNQFNIDPSDTFYSGVISHAYYSIFYCAKAMLLSKKIETSAPEVHRKTFDMFKEIFIDTGLLDKKLFEIYNEMIIKADTLLDIFKLEKKKRGNFTYNTIPQANKAPAQESIENAKTFYRHCNTYLSQLK